MTLLGGNMKYAIGLALAYLVGYILIEVLVANLQISYGVAVALIVIPITAILLTIAVMESNQKNKR